MSKETLNKRQSITSNNSFSSHTCDRKPPPTEQPRRQQHVLEQVLELRLRRVTCDRKSPPTEQQHVQLKAHRQRNPGVTRAVSSGAAHPPIELHNSFATLELLVRAHLAESYSPSLHLIKYNRGYYQRT